MLRMPARSAPRARGEAGDGRAGGCLFPLRVWVPATARRLAPVAIAVLLGMGAAGGLRPTSGTGAEPAGFRALAPGVLTEIPPSEAVAEMLLAGDLYDATIARRDLAWQPKQSAVGNTFLGRAAGGTIARELWSLEFAFKPPRLIEVDLPTAGQKMRRTRIWYLIYRVRNGTGERAAGMRLEGDGDGKPADYRIERFERPIRFVPRFVLESLEPLGEGEGLIFYRGYLDRVMPTALGEIRRREDPQRELFDSASMAETEIQPGEDRWGVATWHDVDPRIDFFSITVTGLTNALQWRLRPGAEPAAADPPNAKIETALGALRLDFWAPGDDGKEPIQQAGTGFRGMFERVTLGGRLLDDATRPGLHATRPEVGLERLGLSWGEQGMAPEMLEPDLGEDPTIPDWGSLRPLQAVIRRIAALPEADDRVAAAREVFGERGLGYLRGLYESLGEPDAARAAVLEKAYRGSGLAAERVKEAPLGAVAELLARLENLDPEARRAEAVRLFGPAGEEIAWLVREAQAARALATLEALGLRPRQLTQGDALAAFASLETVLRGETDEPRRTALLRALFGPRGPALYRSAVAQGEGIDHAWEFRYDL